jgi:hypothetical protein
VAGAEPGRDVGVQGLATWSASLFGVGLAEDAALAGGEPGQSTRAGAVQSENLVWLASSVRSSSTRLRSETDDDSLSIDGDLLHTG